MKHNNNLIFRCFNSDHFDHFPPFGGLQASGNKRDCLPPNAQSVACNVESCCWWRQAKKEDAKPRFCNFFFDEGLRGFDGSWLSKEFDVERKLQDMMPLYHEAICSYLTSWCRTLHCLKRFSCGKRKCKPKQQIWLCACTNDLYSSKLQRGRVAMSIVQCSWFCSHPGMKHQHTTIKTREGSKFGPRGCGEQTFWTKIIVKCKDGNKPWVFGGVH